MELKTLYPFRCLLSIKIMKLKMPQVHLQYVVQQMLYECYGSYFKICAAAVCAHRTSEPLNTISCCILLSCVLRLQSPIVNRKQ
jgi:hypothetical protein